MSSQAVEETVDDGPEAIARVGAELNRIFGELDGAKQSKALAEAKFDVDTVVKEQARINVLDSFARQLKAELARLTALDAERQAKARIIGCRRALGSVISNLDEDEARIRALVKELAEAIGRANDRYRQALGLGYEVAALKDRFDLDAAPLPSVVPPGARDALAALPRLLDYQQPVRPSFEDDEHGLRARRTYTEISGTKGAEIIALVGPKEWPAPTREQQMVIDNLRQNEARKADQLSSLPTVPTSDAFPLLGQI